MLVSEYGSLVKINEALGRNARDSTLSQILNQAPNTSSGKAREMGTPQARALEAACKKEPYWLDRDPELDAALERLRTIDARERASPWNTWPFTRVTREDYFTVLSEADRGAVEGYAEARVADARRSDKRTGT